MDAVLIIEIHRSVGSGGISIDFAPDRILRDVMKPNKIAEIPTNKLSAVKIARVPA
jgi:hypothetical protein